MNNVNIKYLKDENGSVISPVTSVDSVYTQGGGKLVDYIYPIGSIYLSVNNTNPGTLFGGTWSAWGSGKTIVGVNSEETEFATVEQTGGEKTHKLTENQLPKLEGSFTTQTDVMTSGYSHTIGSVSGIMTKVQVNRSCYYVKEDNWNNSSQNQLKYHGVNISFGNDEEHNNLQPYITCYMWKRTA